MASRDRKADSARSLPAPPGPIPYLVAAAADPPAPPHPRGLATPRLHPDFDALLRSPAESARRFGQMVRAVRIRKGFTQRELAARSNVHRTHLSLIEQARRLARIDTICTLAAGLQVPPSELMPTPLSPVAASSPSTPTPRMS